MKTRNTTKIIFFVTAAIAFCLSLNTRAQLRIGAFGGYAPGIGTGSGYGGGGVEYFIPSLPKLSVAPSFAGYEGQSWAGTGTIWHTETYWEFNMDTHTFWLEKKVLYVIFGLNITNAKTETADMVGSYNPTFETSSSVGVNLGFGASFLNGKRVNPFAEIKYASPIEAVVISGGIRVTILGLVRERESGGI